MQRNKETSVELVNLTATMFLTMAYSLVVCWTIPVVPMILVLMLDYSFTSFVSLWIAGLPFCAVFIFCLPKKVLRQFP